MKLKFGYDVSDLTAYVNEEKLPLLMASVFSGESADFFEWQQGIKYKEKLNYMDIDILMRADTGCSTFTSSGDTTFTQKEISVDSAIHETAHCPADLEDYWARIGLQKGSYQDALPFEQEWTGYYNEKVKAVVETQIWQGNKSTGSGNLALVNGFIKAIDDDTATVDATAQASISTTTIIGILDDMVSKLPAGVQGADDLVFCMGWDTFRILLQKLRDLNYFHINGAETSPYTSGEYMLDTWGVKIKAFRGLTGTNRIFLSRQSNFIIGTDLQGDYEAYDLWYEKKDDKILTRLKYKLGTQIKFGAEMVQYSNS